MKPPCVRWTERSVVNRPRYKSKNLPAINCAMGRCKGKCDWRRAAIHEAGHGVAFEAVGISIKSLSLWMDRHGVSGHSELASGTPSSMVHPWEFLVAAQAGYQAERKLLRVVRDMWRFRSDCETARDKANLIDTKNGAHILLNPNPWSKFVERAGHAISTMPQGAARQQVLISVAGDLAANIVCRHRREIKKLARKLLSQPERTLKTQHGRRRGRVLKR